MVRKVFREKRGSKRSVGESLRDLERKVRAALSEVPFVELQGTAREEVLPSGAVADFVAHIRTPAGERQLVFELESDGFPRTLRMAAQGLKASLEGLPNASGVIACPYITDRGREVCREAGVGCIDEPGNVLLAFDQVLIYRWGYPNPAPVRRLQRSLFAPKSTRILRVLLREPTRRWYVRDLATEASMSMSQTSNMKRLLREQDLLAEDGRLFWLAKPEELLQEWTRVYSYEVNDVREFYSMLSTGEAEEKIAEECERRSIRYGLALFSGADRVAPRTRYNRTFAFVDAEQDEVAGLLSMKPVPSGANVVLMRPYDDGVFYGLQEMQGAKVVSDIQLYLDLKSYRGRGNEAADFLFETRIEPRWRQQRNHTTTPTP